MRNKNILYAFAFLIIATFSSCKKDDEVTPLPTFESFVKSNSNLTMFAQAVEKANLKNFTTGPGPFTWFAPTNAAFTAAGITQDSLNKLTSGQISYYLMYHLVNADYATQDMIAQNSISRTTQSNFAVFNGSFNNQFYVNGGLISSADKALTNGRIHVVDKFLVPPIFRGNIQAIIRSTGQHTLFESALTKAGAWAQFATASIFTVMAPTDAAMNAAGFSATYIAATSAAVLLPQLRYHFFLNTRLFTNDLAADPTTIATAAGPSTSLTTSVNGSKVRGKNNTAALSITASDILGTNGVVHIIDGVLR